MLGSIYPRLGDIQLGMNIGEGALGAALLGGALGAQISLMFGTPLVEKLGVKTVIIGSIMTIGVAETAAAFATTPLIFFICLAVAGLAIGGIEIVINLEADRTEYMLNKRIMNRSHAFWSFGFFLAGFIGAIAGQFNIIPGIHLIVLTLITSLLAFIVFKDYVPAPARTSDNHSQPLFVKPTPGIMMIVIFTLSAMLLEGAGADWSVIFMRDTFVVPAFVSGLAFALGALAQGIARFFADQFVDKYGSLKVARLSIYILGLGVLLVTFSIHPIMALLGFVSMGVGTSCIFPLAMSAAAQKTDRSAASNVASLAQFSFIVFLVAPPLLGFVAEHYGIRISFAIGIPLVVISLLTVSSLESKPSLDLQKSKH